MANVKKGLPFVKKRFEYVLDIAGYSKNAFSKLIFPNVKDPLRKLQKYMSTGEIPFEILDRISKQLDVTPRYLTGDESITEEQFLNEYRYRQKMTIEDFKEKGYWFDPDGLYIDDYFSYRTKIYQSYREKQLVSFLNTLSIRIRKEDGSYLRKRFDFSKIQDLPSTRITMDISSFLSRLLNITDEYDRDYDERYAALRDELLKSEDKK